MTFALKRDITRGVLTLDLTANAWNPCSPSSVVGGEIDMQAIFTISLQARTIAFVGVVDAFPAFEAYATVNDGSGVAIFTKAPPKGNTVMNLPGSAATKIEGVILEDSGGGVLKRRELAGTPRFTPLVRRIKLHESRTA
jgi:hypothetical protein